jgi:hypothetical protein
LETLKAGECLTAITSEFDRKTHWEYCEKAVRDHHEIYRELVHPGWLLSQANLIFTSNEDGSKYPHSLRDGLSITDSHVAQLSAK